MLASEMVVGMLPWAAMALCSEVLCILFLYGTVQRDGLVRGKLITGETKARSLEIGMITLLFSALSREVG